MNLSIEASTHSALEALALLIEQQAPGMRASILLLSDDGQHLLHGAAPHLPKQYNESIHGLSIGPQAGSCGTAAYTRERVVVSDIAKDPLWNDYRDLALPHGLASCWSMPIVGARGEILGTFALYYGTPLSPDAEHLQLIETAAFLAAQIIERENASKAKSNFLATMSHELRTPLNAMLGYTQLLLEGIPESISPGVAERVERIQMSAHHLLELIDEILTFSRLEAGQSNVYLETRSVASIVKEAAEIVEPLAEEKNLQLQASCDVDAEITSDIRKIRQILLNLLGNAIKFTQQGSISFNATRHGDSVRFEVSDTGIGIPPTVLSRVFEPFYQVEQAKHKRAPGTGLGLTVSQKLAQLLGGEIAVQSAVDQGTVFTVELPLIRTWPGEKAAAAKAVKPVASP